MAEIEQAFSPGGALAAAIPGFRARAQQQQMAAEIAAAIAGGRVLVAEAGTGTGKTFAYLVPALLAGGKVIVSTGTKNLQDQLFKRDLPTVRDALKVPVSTALLKGRSNYVCPYHLKRNARDGLFQSPQDAAHFRAIVRFAETTHSGDKAECATVPEDLPVWSMATSTRDNCLGQECPDVRDCYVLAARKRALEADLVVVNHHLFFADVVLRDEGMAELLPAVDTVIFDEAHQLPETATMFFGDSISTSQILELARDTRSETAVGAPDCRALLDESRALDKAARDLRLAIGLDNARLGRAQLVEQREFLPALEALATALARFQTLLDTQAERSEGLASCLRRCEEIRLRLQAWQADWRQGAGVIGSAPTATPTSAPAQESENAAAAVSGLGGPSGSPSGSPEDDHAVCWVEVFTQALVLNRTPLRIAPLFRRQVEADETRGPRAWIFTSATLAVREDCSHYCVEMGLADLAEPPVTRVWGSPFDYAEQAILYAPAGLPDPNSPGFLEQVAARAFPLIQAARGRAFVLCTSLRAMRRLHELLGDKMRAAGLDLPLLLQGERSRSELLQHFRSLGNAVLVASQSFWEGVDVAGDALSLVIIDKLPFAPPDDPVLSARVEDLKRQGHNPFASYQLPRAIISLKQGAGRLIRSEGDRGVLAIFDPRMIDKPYGQKIWRSLPPMHRTRDEAEVVAFLASL